MNTTESLLVEIRTEELPPRQVERLARDFTARLLEDLRGEGFADVDSRPRCDSGGEARRLATPRRFAALIDGVRSETLARTVSRRGPRLDACYDKQGKPSRALLGFMRAVGVDSDAALCRRQEAGGVYVAYEGSVSGVALDGRLPAMVERALLAQQAPRLMRWGDSEFRFVRPVRGVLMQWGGRVFGEGTVLGVAPTLHTVGHPVRAPEAISLGHAGEYEARLAETGEVVVEWGRRREEVVRQLGGVCGQAGLLEETVALCERPTVYEGRIDADLLALPDFCVEECLVRHQRIFPIVEEGRLSARFHFVADNRPANPAVLVNGVNRVVRARLRDVEFYLRKDGEWSLDEALDRLRTVAYHRLLGSQYERVARLAAIADGLAGELSLSAAEGDLLARAVRVCKGDLATQMVGEYPKLEGRMAAHYFCAADVVLATVVRAHNDRDWRRFCAADGAVARVLPVLVLSERLERLVGLFGVGERPSGSKDPHGCRAAAMDVVEAQAVLGRVVSVERLVAVARGAFDALASFDAEVLWDFVAERKRREILEGEPSETMKRVLNAVCFRRHPYLVDMGEKAAALFDFLRCAEDEAEALTAINKRCANILDKSAMDGVDGAVEEGLLREAAERELYAALVKAEAACLNALEVYDYGAVLRQNAAVRPAVDAFFDGVLVNAEDAGLRRNRLLLVARLHRLLTTVADFARLYA